MKKLTIFLTLAAFIIGGVFFHSCQKEENLEQSASDVEMTTTKSAVAGLDCQTNCIDSNAPEYFLVHEQLVIGWAGPDITVTANFEEKEVGWPIDTETEIVDVLNPATGKTWMDRNLGATRAAISSTDKIPMVIYTNGAGPPMGIKKGHRAQPQHSVAVIPPVTATL